MDDLQKHKHAGGTTERIQSLVIIPSAFTLVEQQKIFIVSGANAVGLLVMRSPGIWNMVVPPDGQRKKKLCTECFHSGGANTLTFIVHGVNAVHSIVMRSKIGDRTRLGELAEQW